MKNSNTLKDTTVGKSQSTTPTEEKTLQKSRKKSTKSLKKSTKGAKQVTKTTKPSKDSIYRLDTWKWNYEEVTKPEPRVVKALKTRIKHAWKVLRG